MLHQHLLAYLLGINDSTSQHIAIVVHLQRVVPEDRPDHEATKELVVWMDLRDKMGVPAYQE